MYGGTMKQSEHAEWMRGNPNIQEVRPGTFGCVGNTIRCRSGIYFDYANPRVADVRIEDIAIGLANEPRFAGQCDRYSVAEHSVAMAMMMLEHGFDRDCCFAALIHDSPEFCMKDLPKPLRVLLPDYNRIYKTVEVVIFEAFGIDYEKHSHAIKLYDQSFLIYERNALFYRDGVEWFCEHDILKFDYVPRCLDPVRAELEFWRAFNRFKPKGI